MFKVTGLWKNEKEGKVNLAGTIGSIRVVIFPNTFKKEGSNEPDYQMYFDEQKKEAPKEAKKDIDDIPF